QLKALLNLIGFEGEGEGRHPGEEEGRRKKREEEGRCARRGATDHRKILRQIGEDAPSPLGKETTTDNQGTTGGRCFGDYTVTGKSFISPFGDHRFNKRRNSTGVP
ncbi:hypothetical protein PIB30_100666, partial [Stylosanthes scabra]|nr:hypothetical protein [Stylosanthes scabra]